MGAKMVDKSNRPAKAVGPESRFSVPVSVAVVLVFMIAVIVGLDWLDRELRPLFYLYYDSGGVPR